MDSQPAQPARYEQQRAIVVPPAIYFLDAQDALVEVLQGEVQRAQIEKLLGRR